MKLFILTLKIMSVLWTRIFSVINIAHNTSVRHQKYLQLTCEHKKVFTFTSSGQPGLCPLFTCGRHGMMLDYGKKVRWQRQYDALGNVLLGNLGAYYSCRGGYTKYTPMAMVNNNSSRISRIKLPVTLQKFWNVLRNMTWQSSKCFSQISQILI